jgi:hypothetical protein
MIVRHGGSMERKGTRAIVMNSAVMSHGKCKSGYIHLCPLFLLKIEQGHNALDNCSGDSRQYGDLATQLFQASR